MGCADVAEAIEATAAQDTDLSSVKEEQKVVREVSDSGCTKPNEKARVSPGKKRKACSDLFDSAPTKTTCSPLKKQKLSSEAGHPKKKQKLSDKVSVDGSPKKSGKGLQTKAHKSACSETPKKGITF